MIPGSRIGVGSTNGDAYPKQAPYPPSVDYPELAHVTKCGDEPNSVYGAVRASFRHLGLDRRRAGSAEWNPLGDIIRPGQRVLLKPNLVRHANHGDGGTDCLVTHGSVVRAVLDYVLLALEGRGEVWIGDAPIQSAEFEEVLRVTGIRSVVEDARTRTYVPVHLVDFRRYASAEGSDGLTGRRNQLTGDPNGLVAVDLGERSLLASLDGSRFRVTGYDAEETPEHHTNGRHEYLFSRTALLADVIVNIPKLKTHRKAGLTCALKNLVGLNGDKAWLPHHRAGSVAEGGDEYAHPSVRKAILGRLDGKVEVAGPGLQRTALDTIRRTVRATNRIVPFPDAFREGSWYGNDTVWRMALDLNRAALYARDGGLFVGERRGWLNVVDAVVCGEGEGPLRPDPVQGGTILAGVDSAMIDLAAAKMAGFDPAKLPIVAGAFETFEWPITTCRPEDLDVVPELPPVPLRPSHGWRGQLGEDERKAASDDPYRCAVSEIR